MPFMGGGPPATGGGSRPVYTQEELMNESGANVGTVPSGGTSNTYGAWVNIGTTGFAVDSFLLQISFTALRVVMVDVSYGASGGANMVADRIAYTLAANVVASTYIPCRIPSGQSVWIRTNSLNASTAFEVALTTVGPQTGFSFAECDSLSTAASTNALGAVVPVDNVGTWVSIGTTAATYAGFLVYCGGNGDATRTAGDIIVRLGIGAPGSQAEFFSTFVRSGTGTFVAPCFGPFYANVPSGSQIWARADAATATGDTANINFYGLLA